MQINQSMLKELKKFMRGLISSSFAKEFRKPVDVVGLGLTDYDLIITCPMDLGTMKNKLQESAYLTLEEFKEDFDLLCKNCYTYNTNHNDYVPSQCRLLENAFKKYILTFEERVKKGEFEKKRRSQQDKAQKKEKPPKPEKPKPEENKLRIAIYPPQKQEQVIEKAPSSNVISLNIPTFAKQEYNKIEAAFQEQKKQPNEIKLEVKEEQEEVPALTEETSLQQKIVKALMKLDKREFFKTYPSIDKEEIVKAVIEETKTPSQIFRDIIVKMCTDDADIEVIQQFHHFWCSKVQIERPTEEILEEFNQESSHISEELQPQTQEQSNNKITLDLSQLTQPEERKQTELQKEASKIVLKLDQIEPVPQEEEEDEEESNSQEFIESEENQGTKIAINVQQEEPEPQPSLKVKISLPPIPAPKLQMIPSPRIAPVPMMQLVSSYGTRLHPAQTAPNITKTPQRQLNQHLQRLYYNFRKDKELLKIRKAEFVTLPPAKWKKVDDFEASQPYSLVQFSLDQENEEALRSENI